MAEGIVALQGCLQLPRPYVEAPDAETTGLGRESKSILALLLGMEPPGHLGHQRGVLGLQADQTFALDGDVDLAREEIGQIPLGITHRRHEQPVPE